MLIINIVEIYTANTDNTKYIYGTIILSDYNLIAIRYKKLLVRYQIKIAVLSYYWYRLDTRTKAK